MQVEVIVRMNKRSQRVQVPAVHPHPVRSLDHHPSPDPDPGHDHVLNLTQQVPIGVAVAVDMVAAVPVAVIVIVVTVRSEWVASVNFTVDSDSVKFCL